MCFQLNTCISNCQFMTESPNECFLSQTINTFSNNMFSTDSHLTECLLAILMTLMAIPLTLEIGHNRIKTQSEILVEIFIDVCRRK